MNAGAENVDGLETATLAGGCFWCLEAVYLELRGVKGVVSGYAGGRRPNPTYEQVCGGATGHAEVVQITFDASVISYRDLLDVFFTIHDPTTPNRQGNDVGTQYRSAIFYHTPEQERVARETVAAFEAQHLWDDPIVTEIVPLTQFWPAEAYHQNYFARKSDKSVLCAHDRAESRQGAKAVLRETHSLRRSPMSRAAVGAMLAFVTVAVAPGAVQAQGQPAPPPRLAASSFATVEVHVNARKIGKRWFEEDASLAGPSRIAIAYGQPHARGRKVEGGLVPFDTVWRFGANDAAAFHTDVDVVIGNLRVPRGDYTLFILATRDDWQLIVNRATGQWGTEYDKSKDFGHTPLMARKLAEPEESLSIYLVPDSAGPQAGVADLKGTLRIKWGSTELSTGWHVEN